MYHELKFDEKEKSKCTNYETDFTRNESDT